MNKLFSFLILSCACFGHAQEPSSDDAKLVRIDILSIGIPKVVSTGVEVMVSRYVPFESLKNKFSVFGNIGLTRLAGNVSMTTLGDNATINLGTYEVGINYYLFNRRGTGLYLSASLNIFDANLKSFDISKLANGFTGTLDGNVSQFGFNGKLGFKAGNKFYFRTEIGYTQFFDTIIGKLNGTAQDSTGNFNVTFNDAKFTVKDILDTVVGSSLPPITFNIGFGISFL